MNFTPQQLSGAGSYNSKVRIGNWNEDLALSDVKTKSIVQSKALGNRLLDQACSRTWAGEQPIELTPSSDGLVRFGHSVSLYHEGTERLLASNLAEKLASVRAGLDECQASGMKDASLRASFVILPTSKCQEKEFLEFGDEFLLATHPGLAQESFYLSSIPSGLMGSASGNSRAPSQGVSVACSRNGCFKGYMRWRIEETNGDKTLPPGSDRRVRAFENVLLVNCASGKALALDSTHKIYSDYGEELTAFCCLDQPTRRLQMISKEHKGVRDPHQLRPVTDSNVWMIQTGFDRTE